MYRLAFALHRPVEEIEKMPSWRLTEYLAFASIEPIGDQRRDLQNAVLCATVHNSGFGATHSRSPKDFLPRYGVSKEQLDREREEELERKFTAFAMMHNAREAMKEKKK